MLGTIKKVSYQNFSNRDFATFDLITCCSFDNENSEVSSYLNRESVMSERYDGSYHNVSMYRYTERFEPTVSFLKKDFSDFTREQVREVLAWLTSASTPSYADFYDDIYSEAPVFCALGGWTDIQIRKISNGRVVGIIAKFSCVHPWALSPINTYRKIITGSTTANPVQFEINCENDTTSFIYPRITVKHNGTSVKITNTIIRPKTDLLTGVTANKTQVFTTAVRNSIVGETVTIDGANKQIYSSRTTRTFGDDFSSDGINDKWNWLPLVEGKNIIQVVGDCELEFMWRSVIKCGEF